MDPRITAGLVAGAAALVGSLVGVLVSALMARKQIKAQMEMAREHIEAQIESQLRQFSLDLSKERSRDVREAKAAAESLRIACFDAMQQLKACEECPPQELQQRVGKMRTDVQKAKNGFDNAWAKVRHEFPKETHRHLWSPLHTIRSRFSVFKETTEKLLKRAPNEQIEDTSEPVRAIRRSLARMRAELLTLIQAMPV